MPVITPNSSNAGSVMCLAVNDAYVMQAWATAQQVPADLLMLADDNASFTRALGLEPDGTAFGLGLRTRRFALYTEDGRGVRAADRGTRRATGF